MSTGDGVLTRALVVLVPLEGDLEKVQTDETCILVILVGVMRRTFVPAGMETVWTLAPERPFTLQVMSFDVTSVTGLLFGGTRRNLFWPWSTPLTQMYCIVAIFCSFNEFDAQIGRDGVEWRLTVRIGAHGG